jgi:hypothetical protein
MFYDRNFANSKKVRIIIVKYCVGSFLNCIRYKSNIKPVKVVLMIVLTYKFIFRSYHISYMTIITPMLKLTINLTYRYMCIAHIIIIVVNSLVC